MPYRADIDGLRAIAVIAVILFHGGFERFGGGYFGVDVFFVISGYLISNIILADLAKGRFSLWRFYERRARRILPAFVLMILFCIPLAYFLLLPHEIKDFSQSVVASSLFLSNYFFYLETDYFNEFTNNAPLLHTWSLAVEEQFYLFYPLFLIAIYRYFPKWRLPAIILIAIASFTAATITVDKDPVLAFYSTPTRIWEIALGAIIAHWQFGRSSSGGADDGGVTGFRIADFAVMTGLAAIAYAVLAFDSDVAVPSFPALVPTLGTVLILVFGASSKIAGKLLSNRLMVAIGLGSYSLYLFHQPVLSFAHHYFTEEVLLASNGLRAGAIALTALLAWGSTVYVERPIRYGFKIERPLVFAVSGSILSVFVLLGYAGHRQHGFQQYFAKAFNRDGGVLLVDRNVESGKIESLAETYYRSNIASFDPAAERRILVIGDSLARDTFVALYRWAGTRDDLDVRMLGIDDDCMGQITLELKADTESSECIQNFEIGDARALLSQASDVILTANWYNSTYLSAYRFSQYLSAHYPGRIFVSSSVVFADMTSVSMAFARKGVVPSESGIIMRSYVRRDVEAVNAQLRDRVMTEPDIGWIEKHDFFCESSRRSCMLFDEEGKTLIWDSVHITERALDPFAQFLIQRMEPS